MPNIRPWEWAIIACFLLLTVPLVLGAVAATWRLIRDTWEDWGTTVETSWYESALDIKNGRRETPWKVQAGL